MSNAMIPGNVWVVILIEDESGLPGVLSSQRTEASLESC